MSVRHPRWAIFVPRQSLNVSWRAYLIRSSASGQRLYSQSNQQRNDDELNSARIWLANLGESSLPKTIGDVSYSRSSGPGGQNVNKSVVVLPFQEIHPDYSRVNSKAQLRVPLDRLLPFVPTLLHSGIKSSRYYVDKNAGLLFQSDDSRKQGTNRDSCFRKLQELLIQIGKEVVPGETSDAQREKVKALKHSENETRLRAKKQASSKKASRSNGLND